MAIQAEERILAYLRENVSPRRAAHCRAVAGLARDLAPQAEWDPGEAYRAGLAHDCAKEWGKKRLVAYARRHRLRVPALDFIVARAPNLLHAHVGAHFSSKRPWAIGPAGRRAIASHTLGRGGMTPAEIVLFVADFTSPDRRFPSAKKIRSLALKDLRAGFREAVRAKIGFQLLLNKPLHPAAIGLWNETVLGLPKRGGG